MEFGMLGPLEVREGSSQLALGGPKQRKLFARLLLDRNRVVSLDSLIDALWPERVPSDPAHQIQVYVSQIRKALGPNGAALETAPPGYRLRTDPEKVDLDRFEHLCADARAAGAEGDFAATVAFCDQALGLWRGPFMHGFEGEEFIYPESVRVEALRSQVEIDRLTALVRDGRARNLLPELEARVAENPSDERYVLLLMQAMHQAGRNGDAIDAFHRLRTALADNLGIDPSPELQDLFTKILRGDPPPRSSRAPLADANADEVRSDGHVGLFSRASRSQLVIGGVLLALLVSVSAVVVLTRGPLNDEIGSLRPNSLGAIDPGSGRIVANLTLPVRPTRVAAGFGALWITSASSGQVVRVDPETLSIRQEIDLGRGIGPISFADSAVWVANVDAGSVTRIDPVSNEAVQTVSVGNGPSDMTAADAHLWIANRLDGSVAKFDPRRGKVLERIPVGLSPAGIVATEDSLWVTDEGSATIAQLDLASESAVSAIHVGSGPGPVIASGDAVWVVNRSDETLSRIGQSGSVEATLSLGHDASSIEVVEGAPWVAHRGGVERIDPDAAISAGIVASGAAPTDLAFAADRVWVVTEPSLAEHSGGTLRMISDPVGSLDPAEAYSPDAWRVLEALNDGLLAFAGPDTRSLVGNLAVRVPTPGDAGRTYTFQLRDDVRYSNGEEVRPADVLHSFERLLGNRHPVAGLFSSIRGAASCLNRRGPCDLTQGIVPSESSRTVTFHLASPDPGFLSKLAMPMASILPRSVPMRIQASVPSTGPYEVAAHDRRRLVLERRVGFAPWNTAAQPAGYVDRIVVDMSEQARARTVLAGDADWTDLSGSDVSGLRRRHGSQIREYPLMGIWAVFLNNETPPFDDVEVRRAINLAVDREAVQQTFGGSEQASVTCQILPPGSQGYEPFCPYTLDAQSGGLWRGRDLQRARRLVRGKEREPITVYGFEEVADAARYVVAAFRDLGYPAKSRILPIEDFFEMASTQPGIQAGVFGWFADAQGAFGFITPTFSCTQSPETNYAHHCDPVVDRLSRRAASLQHSNPPLASEIWTRVDRRLTRAAAWIPLVNPKGVELVSERLGNYSYSPLTGMILSEAWVE